MNYLMRFGYIVSFLAFASLISGCGQHLTRDLRVSEGLRSSVEVGTLILVEIVTPLKREQILDRFRPIDLEAADINANDVRDGSAVFASPYKQGQGLISPADGIFVLIPPGFGFIDAGPSWCINGRCSWSGDVATIRVVKRPAGGNGEQVLYIADRIVESRRDKGDCFYSSHYSLFCNSLKSNGWQWQEDLFVKPATVESM
jgi:hypothetical protein